MKILFNFFFEGKGQKGINIELIVVNIYWNKPTKESFKTLMIYY